MAGTKRQTAIRAALRALAPQIPLADAEAVLSRAGGVHLKTLPPAIALWLALGSHVRHAYTDYDRLLAEGYEREAARFFIAADTDAVLTRWGCRRSVSEGADDDAG